MKKLLLLALVIPLIGCQTIQQKEVTEFNKNFNVGDVIENKIIVGNIQIPLLSGKQVIIAVQESTNKNSYTGGGVMPGTESASSIGRIVLANVKNNIVQNATLLNVSLYSYTDLGWQVDRICKRKDTIHFVAEDKNMKSQSCWIANHQRMSMGRKVPKVLRDAFKYAAKKDWNIPENMFGTAHMVTNNGDMANIRYLFNPEIHNISAPKHMDWSSSDWHRDRIHMFKDKRIFADKIIVWGKKWHRIILEGLNKKDINVTETNMPEFRI